MLQTQPTIRTRRGVQRSFLFPSLTPRLVNLEPKGVVYTKPWVVELLLDLAGYHSSANLVDKVAVEPSLGEGAFLCLMIERLLDSCQKLGRPLSDCRNSLIAYELDQKSANSARAKAVNILLARGLKLTDAQDLAAAWIITGDYLLDSFSVEADFIIGNPPYVRLEEIPQERGELYRESYSTMRGRADLYVAFFEAALRQLKADGVCAFICADRWMRNQYGAELRQMITSEFSVDVVIEMHNADAFQDEVDAYPAITVIRNQKQGKAMIASAGPEVANIPSATLASNLLNHLNHKQLAMLVGLRAACVDSWFTGSDPWPCQSPEQLALLRKLEDEFQPLEAKAKVGIGVATGHDKVFITKDSRLVEPSRLLKLAMAKDIAHGAMNWSGHYLVDPWNGNGLVILDEYPRLKAYFDHHGDALKKRHTAVKSAHAWYKTIDRVTHALTEKPKLYIADIKNILDPVLDQGETYPHHNLYFIQSDEWDLEVLGGLLISAIGQFFVSSYGVRMRGGYFRFQAQYLRRIRLPDPSTLTISQKNDLTTAFRSRDRVQATEIALKIYGISQKELDNAIGHQ